MKVVSRLKLSLLILAFVTSELVGQESFSLSGTVKDAVSGEVMIRATTALYKDDAGSAKGKPVRGAMTNKFGFFSIPKVELGRYTLVVKFIGYRNLVLSITDSILQSRNPLVLKLTPQAKIGEEVVVIAKREDLETPTSSISSVTVSSDFIRQMPMLLGETDIFRVLQLLPGVKSPSELSSGLYVRGGSPDQNLILLDGVPVYNPSHLGGFLSTFNNDALRDVKLIKGGFPAEFGGRLSAVLDLTMKDGSKEKVRGQGGVSLLASRLTVEGPIDSNSTFMIAGRRTYFDVVFTPLLTSGMDSRDASSVPQYYFYDVNAKLNYQLSPNDRLYVSGFFGRDVFNVEDKLDTSNQSSADIFWGNSTLNTRYSHIFSPELFGNAMFLYSNFDFNVDILGRSNGVTDAIYINSGIRDFSFRGELQYFASPTHTIKTGLEATLHRFVSQTTSSIQEIDSVLALGGTSISAMEIALFAQDEWRVSDVFFANIGGRMTYFESGNRFTAEPRLSVAWNLSSETKVTSAFSIVNQFMHLIIRNNINLPTDLWFPSTARIAPERSNQVVLGIERTFADGEYLLQVEGYYKSMKNLYEFQDTADFSIFRPLEDQFTRGDGRAYGVEVFLNKREGDFTGWVGYTLSWTSRTFPELNYGKEFFARYDSRHDFTATLKYQLNEDMDFGAAWTFNSGFAYTFPTGFYVLYDDAGNYVRDYTLYTERNGYRLPAYHRLDLNFGWRTRVFGLKSVVGLSVYNAYNRMNPFAQYVGYSNTDFNQETPILKQFTLFPILPVLYWNFDF